MDDALVVRCAFFGQSAVGKSSLMVRMSTNAFEPNSPKTIGVDISSKFLLINGRRVKAVFYDLAGDARFQSITRSYMREIAVAFVVFDVTHYESFSKVSDWIKLIRTECDNPEIDIVLLGNKSDSHMERIVDQAAGHATAATWGARYSDVSAKLGYNVDLVLESAVLGVLQKVDEGAIDVSQRRFGVRDNSRYAISIEDAQQKAFCPKCR